MDKAVGLGMTVTLNPFMEIDNDSGSGHQWRGGYTPSNSAAFFANYSSYIVEMATLGEAHGVDRLYVGSELKALSTSSTYTTAWQGVITAARAAFSGTISYAANHDEYYQVKFLSNLDEIGIDAYFTLFALAETDPNPTVAEVKDKWATILATIETWRDTSFAGKSVQCSEWGCVPYDGTLYHPWDWSPSEVSDPAEQLLGYQGLLEATDGMADWLTGIDFWHWDMPGGDSHFSITPGSLPGQYIEDYLAA